MLFLSYSREDHDEAVKLEAELLQSNVRVYRDPPALVGDAFWRDKVKEQLSATDILIVLWSKDARLSPWVDQEIRAFCGRVVVIVSDATPWPYPADDHWPWFVFDKRSALSTITSVSECHEISGKTTAMAQEQVCEEQILRKRRELTRLARLELKQLSREAGRPTRITPLGDGTLVQNQWDGGILKRLKAGNGRIIYLATEPVTNLQYSAFVKVSGFPAPPTACIEEFSQPEQPVVGVTWFEASAYAAWAGGVLPTEAEWMCAATYCGEKWDYATAQGHMSLRDAHFNCVFATGSPVAAKRFAPSPGGFLNLCGNTWDWCSSYEGSYRVIKGGGFMDSADFCAIRARYRNAPLDRDCTVGFRMAVR